MKIVMVAMLWKLFIQVETIKKESKAQSVLVLPNLRRTMVKKMKIYQLKKK